VAGTREAAVPPEQLEHESRGGMSVGAALHLLVTPLDALVPVSHSESLVGLRGPARKSA
jgi:hypothetical protein